VANSVVVGPKYNYHYMKWFMEHEFIAPYIFRCVSKIRWVTISFIMSVRPSVRMERLDSHTTDCHEIWYSRIVRKTIQKIQFSLKFDKINRLCTWKTIYIFDQFFLEWEIVSDKKCRGNHSTHFMFNNVFLKIVPFMTKCGKLF